MLMLTLALTLGLKGSSYRYLDYPDFCASFLQMQSLLEGPIGMALYEWKDGKIGQQCIQGGKPRQFLRSAL